MNLRQLSYFVRIAERGSFSAAADSLHVAQSALSRHVKELEDELGGALLDRGSRGVTLSDSGKVLFERARFILSQFEDAGSEVRAHNKELTGTVRLMLPDQAAADEFGAKMSGTVELPFVGPCVFSPSGAAATRVRV